MLVPNHGLQVVPENHLPVGVMLRGDDINGLVGVDGDKSSPAQLLGQIGANDLSSVQTENGIHNGSGHIMVHQGLSCQLSFTLASFQGGHVQIAVDVGVVGGEVAVNEFQRHISVLGHNLHDVSFH